MKYYFENLLSWKSEDIRYFGGYFHLKLYPSHSFCTDRRHGHGHGDAGQDTQLVSCLSMKNTLHIVSP